MLHCELSASWDCARVVVFPMNGCAAMRTVQGRLCSSNTARLAQLGAAVLTLPLLPSFYPPQLAKQLRWPRLLSMALDAAKGALRAS